MTYLAKPGADIVHISERGPFGRTRVIDGEEVRTLEAMCPAFFPNPNLTPYFVSNRRNRKVCKHCQRIARRMALYLLIEANGGPS